MSHRRLTTKTVPEATDIAKVETFDVYDCNNCDLPIPKDNVAFVSGSIILPGGANWPLNGHLCPSCIGILAGLIPNVFKNAASA